VIDRGRAQLGDRVTDAPSIEQVHRTPEHASIGLTRRSPGGIRPRRDGRLGFEQMLEKVAAGEPGRASDEWGCHDLTDDVGGLIQVREPYWAW
jgi:hypothetical protein